MAGGSGRAGGRNAAADGRTGPQRKAGNCGGRGAGARESDGAERGSGGENRRENSGAQGRERGMRRAFFGILLGAAALHAQESGGGEKDMTLTWVNFAILVLVLGYLVAKTMPQFFRSRTFEIQKGIAEAQQVKQEAEKRAREMEAKMAALGAEIEKFRVQAR